MQVHKEGLQELMDEDFLRELGIGCDDSGLQLTQISEIAANIGCEQVWKGNLGPLTEYFYWNLMPLNFEINYLVLS